MNTTIPAADYLPEVFNEGRRQAEIYGFLNFNELRRRFPEIGPDDYHDPKLIEDFVKGFSGKWNAER